MTSISVLKEQEILETPLLLFDCELPSGEKEHWCTHSVTYDENAYAPRVLRHNVFEVSAASEAGIDAVSKISISLANADSHFSQIDRNVGWKGARVTVRFLFFDLKNGVPASESRVVFRGIANPPDEIREGYLRLTFSNRLGLQRALLPAIRVQRRCPWMFPSTAEQRAEAIDGGSKGRYSPFYACGYSAGEVNGAGNLNGGAPYTSCDFTKASCVARGMFNQDGAANPTRRFGGIEFLPASTVVRSHGEQGSHLSETVANEARYNDFVPLIYGTAWYQPPIVFARNDGNLTRLEILLGSGEIQGLVKVLVNDVEIPEGQAGANMTATGWYNLVTTGTRTGGFNLNFTDAAGNPLGDPYGSVAFASVVVPNQVSDGRVLPRIQVLIEGLVLDQFDVNGDFFSRSFTNNPAWILLDILRRCGWAPQEIDLASFARAASHCEELIPASDLHGNPIDVARYQCNLVVRKRRSAADLVRGVRNASGLYVTYGEDGLLQANAESTLAIQHPDKPEDSNSDETLNNGWPVYEFGDGSTAFSGIARKDDGEPSLRMWSRSAAETPNRYTVEFQDAFNEYQQDSLSLVDVDDVLLSGQEITARLSALGIPNFSQAARVMRRQLDRGIRGNLFVEFDTSVRAIGVKPGDLVTLTYLKEGLQRALFRVVKVTAASNQHRLRLLCQKHDDFWYSDDTGTGGGTGRQPGAGVGLPRPLIGKVLDENGDPQFEIIETPVQLADGSMAVGLSVGFVPPARPEASSAGIPLLSLAPTIETTGGTLTGDQTLYYAVSGVDALGAEGPLSFIVRATIPSGGDSNAVTLEGLSFSGGTGAYHVYRGKTPVQLHRIASDVALSGAFTDSGLPTALIGPPDENYDHATFYWRLERVPEHAATTYSLNTIGSDLLEMIVNEHSGAVIRITEGEGAGQERPVISNDANSLTVAPKWDVTPDATSGFVVAESGWHDGASGATSPIEFEVPNREGATVHISGRSVNSHGRECSYDLSLLTRWVIGGGAGLALDADVPGAPVFGLYPTGQGTVELTAVSFGELENTRSIQAGTLTLHYWNELASPTQSELGVALGDTDTTIELAAPGPGYVGALLQIGGELIVVDEVLDGGLRYVVTRGSFDTTPESSAVQTLVYHLSRRVYVIPFVKDFFGSPASGSFSHPIFLPDVRVAAAEMFVTNARGNSETTRNNLTGTLDYGLRTMSGGQLSIQVEGYLAIQTNAAPPLVVEHPRAVRDVFAVVSEAPTGAPIEIEILQDGTPYCTLTIPAGSTMSSSVDGFGLPPLEEKSALTLNILSVGQTPDATPGSDLTVTIRL